MSGEKPIVTRTLALLGVFFFAATRFAFWGFRLAGTVCHHAGAIEHKSQVGSRNLAQSMGGGRATAALVKGASDGRRETVRSVG